MLLYLLIRWLFLLSPFASNLVSTNTAREQTKLTNQTRQQQQQLMELRAEPFKFHSPPSPSNVI